MGKIIKVDFSDRGKSIHDLQKSRKPEKVETREQERINRAVNKSHGSP